MSSRKPVFNPAACIVCGGRVKYRGLCNTHYRRALKHRSRTPKQMWRPRPGWDPALVCQRELRGLTWMGWPITVIADHAGLPTEVLRQVRDGEQRGTPTIWDAVHTCHQLWGMRRYPNPVVADRVQQTAIRWGWAPPLAWDPTTIGYTDARPEGMATKPGQKPRVTRSRAEYDSLADLGLDRDEMAHRLGVTRDAVNAYYYRRRLREQVVS